MSAIPLSKASIFQHHDKLSSKRFLKFIKAVKPIMKLMRKKQRTNAITPSTCNYDVVESFQNELNESELFRLDFKFFGEEEAEENSRNEELERRLLEKLRCVESPATELPWTPRADADVWKSGNECLSRRQTAERQAPIAVA